ncbi:MAG: xanthine dehydrogenase family protein subunit M [Rhodobacteraceae bacterium]|nr:xanthine dehydrogenase family protein subunit M [Paracoccaceae bacterium]
MLPQNKRPPDIGEYVAASSVDAAIDALADGQGTALAGGTDLWAQKDSGNGRLRQRLVNISRVSELCGIAEVAGKIRIGALTTISEILESPLLNEKVPLLPQMANRFAAPQIRNAATIGGNIANASPAADAVLPLIGLGTSVELRSKRETRFLPLSGFFKGPGNTQMTADELITAIEFETPPGNFHGVFCKSGPRPALEISMVAMCLTGLLEGGKLSNPRLVFGAVGPTPICCEKTEAMIDGKTISDDLIASALDLMATEIAPIDDFRASKWYRTQMARTFLEAELIACR